MLLFYILITFLLELLLFWAIFLYLFLYYLIRILWFGAIWLDMYLIMEIFQLLGDIVILKLEIDFINI